MINKFSEANIVHIKYNMYIYVYMYKYNMYMYIKIDPKSIPKFI